jgi:hypothetical protein
LGRQLVFLIGNGSTTTTATQIEKRNAKNYRMCLILSYCLFRTMIGGMSSEINLLIFNIIEE